MPSKGVLYMLFSLFFLSSVLASVMTDQSTRTLLVAKSDDLALQVDNILVYKNENTSVFYSITNIANQSRQILLNLTCACPDSLHVGIDTNHTLNASTRQLHRINISTNQAPLGVYQAFLVKDNQTQVLTIKVISPHFFEQFLYELFHLFG